MVKLILTTDSREGVHHAIRTLQSLIDNPKFPRNFKLCLIEMTNNTITVMDDGKQDQAASRKDKARAPYRKRKEKTKVALSA